jgi:hypothetical protein
MWVRPAWGQPPVWHTRHISPYISTLIQRIFSWTRLWPNANLRVWKRRYMEDFETGIPSVDHELFLRKAFNHTEALCNLIYLIGEEADHPEKVRHYASLSDQSLKSLTQLLRKQI